MACPEGGEAAAILYCPASMPVLSSLFVANALPALIIEKIVVTYDWPGKVTRPNPTKYLLKN
jgi:hypothetical protein